MIDEERAFRLAQIAAVVAGPLVAGLVREAREGGESPLAALVTVDDRRDVVEESMRLARALLAAAEGSEP